MATWLNWKWLALGLAVLFSLGILGCQGTGSEGKLMVRDYLDVLQAGNADGHLTVSTGGSPLQVGMKQVFCAGPENCALAFDGDIDFGGVSAKNLLPATPAVVGDVKEKVEKK
jgi:hypothetical protein